MNIIALTIPGVCETQLFNAFLWLRVRCILNSIIQYCWSLVYRIVNHRLTVLVHCMA